jgi:hypothetical protein
VKQATEDAALVEMEATVVDEELIDLGRMSKETRGSLWGGFEGPDCMPWRDGICP